MANELVPLTTETKSAILWSEQGLPTSVITKLDSPDSILELPAPTPQVQAHLQQWIPLAEQSLRGCPVDEINRMLVKLRIALPTSKKSDAEAADMLQTYREGLADLPRDILGAAMFECSKTCMFFPTIAEIRKHAEPELRRRRFRLDRAKSLAKRVPISAPKDQVDPEKFKAWFNTFKAKTGASEA